MTGAGVLALARSLAVALPAAWLLAVFLAQVLLADLHWASTSLRAFAQATALASAGLLLRSALPAGAATGIVWASALAIVAFFWLPAGAGALGVLLLLLFAAALDAALARVLPDALARARCSLAAFALAGTTPLWGGPLAQQLGGSATALLLGLSPLSLLGVLAEHDYLRDPWFYAHSALGTLRFAYPEAGALVAGYVGGSALLLAAAHLRLPLQLRSIHA